MQRVREIPDQREIIIGWKAIADHFGWSVATTQRAFREADIDLPHLHHGRRTSPVYLVKGRLFNVRLIPSKRPFKAV